MEWLKDPNQSSVDNLNNIRCQACRHFRNKKKEYLKAKIDELVTNSKIKNIRDLYRSISDFKKAYQTRTNILKDEKGDLVAHFLSILRRWRNHFCQLFNVHGVSDIRQTEIRTAEQLVPELSTFEVNPLMPNDHYRGRTAPLTSKRCILYIYSTNTGTEYFKHGIYSPSFSLQNAVCFIILTFGSCITHIL